MESTCRTLCIAAAVVWTCAPQTRSAEPDQASVATVDPLLGKTPGEARDDNGLKMTLVWCSPGFLKMENFKIFTEPAARPPDRISDDDFDQNDEPQPPPRQIVEFTPVKVFLTKGYWLGKYEVTQSEWKQVMKTEPWQGQDLTKDGKDFPATFVDWQGAADFCRILTQQERRAGRLPDSWEYALPTEAQWERACRARTETRFSFGDDLSNLDDYAWFEDNAFHARGGGEQYAHRVGRKKPNPWGLYDMHGNVWEWCRDVYVEQLPGGRDPEVKSDAKRVPERVLRGGCWTDVALNCRSGFHNRYAPGLRSCGVGFRTALSVVR